MDMSSNRFKFLGTLASMLVVGVAVGWFARPRDLPASASGSSTPDVLKPAPLATRDPVAAAPAAKPAPAAMSAADFEKLAEQSMVGSASTRAAAIGDLANAPREQALPVLKRVLLNGEVGIDRPLALRSLRTLALTQGDADGGIRAAVRDAIYHGDDESMADELQSTLGDIEQAAAR
jgi:hypothetical protein